MIDQRLSELIPPKNETIFEAARYSLLSAGKRLRPRLVLATAALFGADPKGVLDPACAIEMIHVYSLIHDDLPCMDDDDLRRGKPTLHKVFGEAIALLTGDYLLNLAFNVIANATGLTAEQKLEMIQVVSHRSGAPGLIGGQVIDMESEGKKIDEETLIQMHFGKTGSLIAAALEVGQIAAGVKNPSLGSIGFDLGLIYQLQDDLFDATSTTAVLGKQAGSDSASKKSTAISIYGRLGTEQKLESLKQLLLQKLAELPRGGGELTALIQKILQRNY